jgi:medium-chain acyl-[acyl-carrier-protein] hydrolase
MLSRHFDAHETSAGSVVAVQRDRAGGWLQWPMARGGAVLRLFCFHHAGVGASVYRHWAFGLPANVEVAAVQLPGRANRITEPPVADIPSLVDALVSNLAPHLEGRFAFFGHSMGAVLAHELAHALRDRGLPSPSHLIVSGRRAPTAPNPFPPLSHLPDDIFVAGINRRYGGIAPEILQHQDVLDLLLPCLRADIAALENFVPPARQPLDIPIAAFGGDSDGQTPVKDLEPWRLETTAGFGVRVFPGGHFYLDPLREKVLAEVEGILRPYMTFAGGSPRP